MTNIPESHRDLIEKNQIVILSTIGPASEPQTTALWFLFEDDLVKLSLNNSRQKLKNLKRNPAYSAIFVDPGNPYRTIELRGTATVEPDPDYVVADKIGAKYGSDLRDMDQPGESRSAVTLHIEKVHIFGN